MKVCYKIVLMTILTSWDVIHNGFFIVKVFKKSKIAGIYYYDPQSAGINLQSPQSDSTPWTLTLMFHYLMKQHKI